MTLVASTAPEQGPLKNKRTIERGALNNTPQGRQKAENDEKTENHLKLGQGR
jgi:hypothetical protein